MEHTPSHHTHQQHNHSLTEITTLELLSFTHTLTPTLSLRSNTTRPSPSSNTNSFPFDGLRHNTPNRFTNESSSFPNNPSIPNNYTSHTIHHTTSPLDDKNCLFRFTRFFTINKLFLIHITTTTLLITTLQHTLTLIQEITIILSSNHQYHHTTLHILY